MSNENTNTPNGVSNELYFKNPDTEMISASVTSIEEYDPTKENTGHEVGDNTKTGGFCVVNCTDIRNFGAVKVVANLVGEPIKVQAPEATSTIKAAMEEFKKNYIAKYGLMPSDKYIKEKIAKTRKADKEKETDEKDIDGNGISDDREGK